MELVNLLRSKFCRDDAVVACVGNELREDDSLGLRLCRALRNHLRNVVECPGGLELCVGEIIERNPRVLIIIDAALFEGDDEIVFAPLDSVIENLIVISTHGIPLAKVVEFIRRSTHLEEVWILGLRAYSVGFSLELSPRGREVLRKSIELLRNVLAQC